MDNSDVRDLLLSAVGTAVSEKLPGVIADELEKLADQRLSDGEQLDAVVIDLIAGFVRENGKEGIDDLTVWLDATLSGESKPPPYDLSAAQLTKIASLMQDAEAKQIRVAKRWSRHIAVILRQAMKFAAFAISA